MSKKEISQSHGQITYGISGVYCIPVRNKQDAKNSEST
jgi:hypothetical protein